MKLTKKTNKIFPSYVTLKQALDKTTLRLPPAEFHGLICGILCGEGNEQANELISSDLLTQQEDKKAWKVLSELCNKSIQLLNDFSLDFQLVLPEERYGLAKRAEALTIWCQGFLDGLAFANAALLKRDDEMIEAGDHLREITRMQYANLVSNEEDEIAYTEITEYVRLLVIFLYQTTHETTQPPKTHSATNSTNKQLH